MADHRRFLHAAGYVIAANLLIGTAVAVVHELGHVITGELLRCGNIRLVVGGGSPATAMRCPAPAARIPVLLGSFVPVVPVSGTILVRRIPHRAETFTALGFLVLAAATDLHLLLGPGMEPVVAGIGAVIAFYGAERTFRRVLYRTERRQTPPQDN